MSHPKQKMFAGGVVVARLGVARYAAVELARAVRTLFMAGVLLSCTNEPSALQVYRSLLNQPLPTSARVNDWKILRGVGELHAFFSIEMLQEHFESEFSRDGFSLNTDEEDPEMLAIYGRDISKRMGHDVNVPSPAIHLVRKSAGRTIHVFWQASSRSLLVWVTPGPLH